MAKTLTQVEVQGIRGYLGKGQVVYLWLEDAAIGLGIVKIDKKDGAEYTRVNAQQVKKMLIAFGNIVSENGGFSEAPFPKTQFDELPQYVPESAFYYMAMKANNETARKFQYLVTTKILPQIRKTGSYGVKVTPQQRLSYLDRIKRAANAGDREMLSALYAHCDELGIEAPKYDMPENRAWRESSYAYANGNYALGLPAVERNDNGAVTIRQHELVALNGETKSLKEWCEAIGLGRSGIRARISRGWTLEAALTTPTKHALALCAKP